MFESNLNFMSWFSTAGNASRMKANVSWNQTAHTASTMLVHEICNQEYP